MPTIPTYNQGATEEAGLTRAKRRVISAMNMGIAKLTERPDKDLTNGKADDIANALIAQFEDLTALFRQVTSYFGATDEVVYLETQSDAVKAIKIVILTARAVSRLLRTAKLLAPVLRYIDLGILADLKSAQGECDEAGTLAFGVLFNLNFEELNPDWETIASMQDADLEEDDLQTQSDMSSITLPSVVSDQPQQRRIDSMFQQMNRVARELEDADNSSVSSASSRGSRSSTGSQTIGTKTTARKRKETLQLFAKLGVTTFEKLVMLVRDKYDKTIEVLSIAYDNFNEFRKQKLFPPEQTAEESVKTASGGYFRRPIYRVGNNVMNALYEIDGLPRYI